MPTATFMISIDCMRSAPPRSSAFQLACISAAERTSRMERGVSKAGLSRVLKGLLLSSSRAQRSKPGQIPELLLERSLEAMELGHQGIADRGSRSRRRVNGGVEPANLALQRHRA